MARLDALDRKLLRVIQRRGNISQTALAEAIGSSPASCWRRVKALERSGILGPTVRLLNPKALGKNLDAVCKIRLKSQDAESRIAFESFVADKDQVMECLSISGDWDYQLRIVADDMDDYEEFLMHQLLSHTSVANSASQFALRRIKYSTALPI